eukprot:1958409-Pleurochrysis_carterae.AAC.1
MHRQAVRPLHALACTRPSSYACTRPCYARCEDTEPPAQYLCSRPLRILAAAHSASLQPPA